MMIIDDSDIRLITGLYLGYIQDIAELTPRKGCKTNPKRGVAKQPTFLDRFAFISAELSRSSKFRIVIESPRGQPLKPIGIGLCWFVGTAPGICWLGFVRFGGRIWSPIDNVRPDL